MYYKASCCTAQLQVIYGPQHWTTILFCIVESEIKVIHKYIQYVNNLYLMPSICLLFDVYFEKLSLAYYYVAFVRQKYLIAHHRKWTRGEQTGNFVITNFQQLCGGEDWYEWWIVEMPDLSLSVTSLDRKQLFTVMVIRFNQVYQALYNRFSFLMSKLSCVSSCNQNKCTKTRAIGLGSYFLEKAFR